MIWVEAIVMKYRIRGGDLDLVEYEFSPFLPGENMRIPEIGVPLLIEPELGVVVVKAPARIHLTVLDMNRFSPGRPGGGGVGFAIQLTCEVAVSCIPNGIEIDYPRAAILRHHALVFSRTVGYSGGFKIAARDHQHKHVGLGSTSTIVIALATAMNEAVGRPLSSDQLRRLVGSNYVEETADGIVTFGFETGVGPAVSLHGGMAVLGDDLALISHHAFAPDASVYIVIPPTDISSAGASEFDLLMNRARLLDYRDRELKAYLIMMDLIPALIRGDLRRIGEIIWEIDFRGSKRAEVEHHGFAIYHYMSRLRDGGLEFVGMSSVGPAIAVISSRTREEVDKVLAPLGLSIAVETAVDNKGLQITRG
jgi:beta-RFAP synthase